MTMNPDAQRRALVIVGMHRSGTSATALAFQRLGWNVGQNSLPTQQAVNRDGFGENSGIVALNESLLASFGKRWFQLFALPSGWAETADGAVWVEKATDVLSREFANESRWLLKDPRLCLTLPLWLAALQRLGIEVRLIVQARSPFAVARSLERRDRLPISVGMLLWLHNTLQAELNSRDCVRAVLQYEHVLERGAAALALFDDVAVDADIDIGIDASLNHGAPEVTPEGPLAAACARVLEALVSGDSTQLESQSALAETLGDELGAVRSSPLAIELIEELTAALTLASADAVAQGDNHSEALAMIGEKDAEIAQVGEYAAQCESVVAEKDSAIAEIREYAQHCEQVVGQKDAEIAEKDVKINALEHQLAKVQSKPLYRVLRKIGLLP